MADKKSLVIEKPKDSQGMNTTDMVSVINDVMKSETENGYHASYVVGVSFGVDLSKWREILSEIFNGQDKSVSEHSFHPLKKFDKAVLITDPVSVKDRHGREAIEANNLIIWLRGNSSTYLHSKMILIALQKDEEASESTKYVLIISSKNITYSKSFDFVVTLYSQEEGVTSGGSGKEVFDYFMFLAKDEEKKALLSKYLPKLSNMKFDVQNEENEYEAHVTDMAFSYGDRIVKHWFSDDVWSQIMKSTLVISPYLTEEQFINWKQNGRNKRLLTYYNSANKIDQNLDENQRDNMPTVYVGIISEEGGRAKFHAKMYAYLESDENGDNHTRIWIGSANLTDEGKQCHWEMLIGLTFNDSNKNSAYIYDYVKQQVLTPSSGGNYNNPLIELYQSKRIGEDTDSDEEAVGVAGRMDKYALFQINGGYEWHIFDSLKRLKESVVVSRNEIGNWIVMDNEDEMEIFVCEDNYMPADVVSEDEGYLKYEDYKKLVGENIKKKKGRYYRGIFLKANPRKGNANKRGRNRKDNSTYYIKYPCLYKNMMEVSERKQDLDIKEELSKLYYDFMDPDDAKDNEIVQLMKAYVESLNEEDNHEE